MHILTVVERRQLQLGTVGLLTFILTTSAEIEAVKYVTKPNHSSDSRQCIHSYTVHWMCTSAVNHIEKLRYKGRMKYTPGTLTGKGLEKEFRSS